MVWKRGGAEMNSTVGPWQVLEGQSHAPAMPPRVHLLGVPSLLWRGYLSDLLKLPSFSSYNLHGPALWLNCDHIAKLLAASVTFEEASDPKR